MGLGESGLSGTTKDDRLDNGRSNLRLLCAASSPLGYVEISAGVLAEVCLQERCRFGYRNADVGQILDLRAQPRSLAIQQVPAAGAVVGHEVQVPACDVDASCILGRPEPNERSNGAGELELRLMGGRIDQGLAACSLAGGAGSEARKLPLDPHGAEQVLRPPHPVELGGQIVETIDAVEHEPALLPKGGD